jgi:hypothetical protein
MLRSDVFYSFKDRRKSYIKTTIGGQLDLNITPDNRKNIFMLSVGGYSDRKTDLIFFENNVEFMSYTVNGSFIFDFNSSWNLGYELPLKIRLANLTTNGSIACSYLNL